MMKLIHAYLSKKRLHHGLRNAVMAFTLVILGVTQSFAQSFSVVECICQNNNSVNVPGLFEETIRVNSGGAGPWTVVSATGLYQNTSTPGNLVPFLGGELIPNVGGTSFEITAFREDDTNWQLVITDGNIEYPLESRHLCQYPGPEILGDSRACLETSDTYMINAELTRVSNIQWSLNAGGTLASVNGGISMDVDWGDIEGFADLDVTATVAAFDGQGNVGQCALDLTEIIFVGNEDTTAMACNNVLNVSMNNSCELFVTPDMVLEDQFYPNDSYEVRLRDVEADTIIPNGIIDMEYLDKLVEVAIIHECSGNSCWGYVNLEDKSIPELVCRDDVTIECDEISTPDQTGFPAPDDAVVTKIRDGVYSVIGFDKCTELIMRYRDEVGSVHCDGEFSSVITRFWSIQDEAGNSDTCSNRIFIEKATLSDITFPKNYDDNSGPDHNPSILACDNNFDFLPNGLPNPEGPNGTGMPEGMFCLNVIVDYIDTRIRKCGDDDDVSYKLKREWIVSDLCNAEQRKHNQFIVVADKSAPEFKVPAGFISGTQGLTCGSEITVPQPEDVFDCSEWTYTIVYRVEDLTAIDGFGPRTSSGIRRNADDTYTITEVPDGAQRVQVVYLVSDACDNVSEGSTIVTIEDNLPPTPVCDQNSFVGLNDDGVGWAGVETFDDGSTDNCMIDKLEIRRMNFSSCDTNLDWSDKIKFCCDDVGKETMVSLRVTDKAGNDNTCMVFVTVQDNQPPVLSNCPGPRTVNCDADVYNLAGFGFPTVTDLCGAEVTEEDPVRVLGTCGKGTVIRTFVATDRSGNTATCSQTITVAPQGNQVFGQRDIRFPADHTITNGCMDSGTDPDDLPNGRQKPIITEKACSNVTYDYNDVVFQFTDGACFKILREWTVLDWCAFDGITGAGIWTHTQAIMVRNNIAPQVVAGCDDAALEATDLGDCRSRVVLTAEGEDDCSLPASLRWSYEFDENNDGSINYTGNTNRIDRVVEHGSFKVTWTVTDECDNSSSCEKVFTVYDEKKPTPYCLTEIVTVIMEDTKDIDIWAKDFNRGSSDNCSDTSRLEFSFSEDITDAVRVYDCEDLTDGELLQELSMYVHDDKGNFDFCTVRLRVQDNAGYCNEGGNRIALGGSIKNESSAALSNVSVRLNADLAEFPRVQQTDEEGTYLFENLLMEQDYSLSAEKDGSYLDGVSTLDLVLIQRHILGIAPLNSAYKAIAADVNADERISATDLVQLRKLILGVINEFPAGENWRFVDGKQTFVNPNKPFPYETAMLMTDMDHSADNMDMVAVKVGDVNNSHESNVRNNETDNRSQKEWILSQNTINDLTEVAVKVHEDALAGFQFAIEFDASQYRFEGVEGNLIDVSSSNLGLNKVNEGVILISWNSSEEVSADGELLTVLFSNISNGDAHITVNPGLMQPEAYTVNGHVQTEEIVFRTEKQNGIVSSFELFQNIPNPFNNTTKIGFTLQNDSNVALTIYDYAGKVILRKNGRYNKGYNAMDVSIEELSVSGVLYYQLDTDTHSASKKMIVIK